MQSQERVIVPENNLCALSSLADVHPKKLFCSNLEPMISSENNDYFSNTVLLSITQKAVSAKSRRSVS